MSVQKPPNILITWSGLSEHQWQRPDLPIGIERILHDAPLHLPAEAALAYSPAADQQSRPPSTSMPVTGSPATHIQAAAVALAARSRSAKSQEAARLGPVGDFDRCYQQEAARHVDTISLTDMALPYTEQSVCQWLMQFTKTPKFRFDKKQCPPVQPNGM